MRNILLLLISPAFFLNCSKEGNAEEEEIIEIEKCLGCETGEITDSRDGRNYNIVKIGDQWWMAENLNVGKRIDNNGCYQLQTDNSIIEKYCYDNSDSIGEIYGGLYEWREMMQYNSSDDGVIGTTQGICPSGWHLPTNQEWTTLTDYLGEYGSGGKMKSEGTAFWFPPNEGATNESGFNALPGSGRQIANKAWSNLGEVGFFWSSTEDIQYRDMAIKLQLQSDYSDVYYGATGKDYGISVRCVKDY